MTTPRPEIDRSKIQRERKLDQNKETPPPAAGNELGTKVVDYAFNPTREKIREMTIVDRIQGRMFPLIDMINGATHYIIEIAEYRQNKKDYEIKYKKERPTPPDMMEDFIYRTAQWSKSIGGTNLTRATDIALAEMEVKGEDDGFGGSDPYKD